MQLDGVLVVVVVVVLVDPVVEVLPVVDVVVEVEPEVEVVLDVVSSPPPQATRVHGATAPALNQRNVCRRGSCWAMASSVSDRVW